ncbi:MAG: RnfH family protein [Lautropia mirabilis]|nr:RnfH family protein [Lautropia mirabilis]
MTHSARRKAPQDQPSAPPDQPASDRPAAALMVELVIQYPEAAAPEATSPEGTNPEACQPVRYELVRTQHRVPLGTTIRQLLQVGQGADLIPGIEAKALGLSRFGRRAWLDDPLRPDDRVEVLCPILADAKAARFARVAKSRAERTDGRWGRRGVADRQIRATKRPSEG